MQSEGRTEIGSPYSSPTVHAVKEELALRQKCPNGSEWDCPRFLRKTKPRKGKPATVVEFPEGDTSKETA